MENLGTFEAYEPFGPYTQKIAPLVAVGASFFQNADQVDFYSLHEKKGQFVAVEVDKVAAVTDDISSINPLGLTLYQLEEGDTKPAIGWHFDGQSFSEPAPKLGTITKRQFKLQMIELEKDDDLEDIIADMPIKEQKKIRAELDANEYHRDSKFVAQLGTALGFSDSEVDALWKEAMKL